MGNDNVPLRADINWQDGAIRCTPRMSDPAALSLLWPVEGFGTVQLQTTRLPPREQPYNLHVELARHQLMRLTVKREEWGLFDYNGMDEIATQIDRARDAFIRALQHADKPEKAARFGDEALSAGLWAAESMARFHASVFLGRRQQTGGFAKPFLGVSLPETGLAETKVLGQVAEMADFVYLPTIWRQIQPTEHAPSYTALDALVKACTSAKLAMRAGPLLTFGVRSVPDWMYIWENDFEAIFDTAREHIERTVQRFAKQVSCWIVASGLQADNVFGFSFEQVIELTRMAASTTRQAAPRAQILIELNQPWGEYYARNPQTIPPLLYADMVVQSGINFDGFGLPFVFGIPSEGYLFRDPFQVSVLVDKLANLGKPLHITALGVPSQAGGSSSEGLAGGQWHAPWSEEVQADWLSTICEIALSKPYVESVGLQPLLDDPDNVIPTGGLFRADHSPKLAVARLIELRQRLTSPPAR